MNVGEVYPKSAKRTKSTRSSPLRATSRGLPGRSLMQFSTKSSLSRRILLSQTRCLSPHRAWGHRRYGKERLLLCPRERARGSRPLGGATFFDPFVSGNHELHLAVQNTARPPGNAFRPELGAAVGLGVEMGTEKTHATSPCSPLARSDSTLFHPTPACGPP